MSWLALHAAAKKGDLKEIEKLVREGADVDARDWMGVTHMHHAAGKGRAEMVELFFRLGSQAIDTPDFDGWTPMHAAAVYDHAPVIETLVRLGSKSLDARDNLCKTPYRAACLWFSVDAAFTLAALGAEAAYEPRPPEDEVHEVRWRVYFRESFVEKLIREIK
jgi:ankyrin repeat protein